MIKAEAIYKNQGKADPKFDHFKLTIGGVVYEDLPIRFLRISELPTLESMLNTAVEQAAIQAVKVARAAEQRAGVERYNRATAALLAVENSSKRW